MVFLSAYHNAERARKPLKIIVAGAGIGGLSAAIALRQQGHEVSIYEQSRMAQETGAAIHIAPNCNGLLRRFGMDPREHGAVELQGLTEYDINGKLVTSTDFQETNKMWQHPWELIHRAHLHQALKNIATSAEGVGAPVQLHLHCGVANVETGTATVTLVNGDKVQGDVVLGADGVHSRTRKSIPGGDLTPFDCGKSAYRFLIPTERLAADPQIAPFLGHVGHLLMWVGVDRRLVMYPCDYGRQMNFVAIHPSAESSVEGSGGDWQQSGNKDRMIQIFEGFGPKVAAILNKIDDGQLKIWSLLDMEKMPSFAHQKFAVLGDAAHPFLPHQAQGGAQAIEDGVSLGALLPLGTTPEEVSERLKLYESQRYERSHRIQNHTRLSGADLAGAEELDTHSYIAYNVGHDEWDSSHGALHSYMARKISYSQRHTPIGFGPSTGPRQPLGLSPDNATIAKIRQSVPETSSLLSVRFRSSRTYLQNFLPPGFSYVSPATVCEASLFVNTLDGMTWLGGGSYTSFTLCLHGIQYDKQNGEEIYGTFVPLLFENLTEPILSGRDEIGMPKLYADIDVEHQDDKVSVAMSWRGTKFFTLDLGGMTSKSAAPLTGGPSSEILDNGHFAWRCVPAVGEPSKPDAEYPVFVPNPDPGKFSKDAEIRVAKEASFRFSPGDVHTLPTLHNIARTLASMPNYGIVEAKHISSVGVDDLKWAYRLK